MARSVRKRNKSTLRKKRVSKQKLSRKKYSSLRKRRKSVKKQRRKYRKRTPKKTKKILSGGVVEDLKEILTSFGTEDINNYKADDNKDLDLPKWKSTSNDVLTYNIPQGREKWGKDGGDAAENVVGNFVVIEKEGIYEPSTLKYKTIMMDTKLHENFGIYCKNWEYGYQASQLSKTEGTDTKKIGVYFVTKLPVAFFYEFQKITNNPKDTAYDDMIPGAYDITHQPKTNHVVNVFTKNENGQLYSPPLKGKFSLAFQKPCLEANDPLCSLFSGFSLRTNMLKNKLDEDQNQKRERTELFAVNVVSAFPHLLFNELEDAFYIDMDHPKFSGQEDDEIKLQIFGYEWANIISTIISNFREEVEEKNIKDEFNAWLNYFVARRVLRRGGVNFTDTFRKNVDLILNGTHSYNLDADGNITVEEIVGAVVEGPEPEPEEVVEILEPKDPGLAKSASRAATRSAPVKQKGVMYNDIISIIKYFGDQLNDLRNSEKITPSVLSGEWEEKIAEGETGAERMLKQLYDETDPDNVQKTAVKLLGKYQDNYSALVGLVVARGPDDTASLEEIKERGRKFDNEVKASIKDINEPIRLSLVGGLVYDGETDQNKAIDLDLINSEDKILSRKEKVIQIIKDDSHFKSDTYHIREKGSEVNLPPELKSIYIRIDNYDVKNVNYKVERGEGEEKINLKLEKDDLAKDTGQPDGVGKIKISKFNPEDDDNQGDILDEVKSLIGYEEGANIIKIDLINPAGLPAAAKAKAAGEPDPKTKSEEIILTLEKSGVPVDKRERIVTLNIVNRNLPVPEDPDESKDLLKESVSPTATIAPPKKPPAANPNKPAKAGVSTTIENPKAPAAETAGSDISDQIEALVGKQNELEEAIQQAQGNLNEFNRKDAPQTGPARTEHDREKEDLEKKLTDAKDKMNQNKKMVEGLTKKPTTKPKPKAAAPDASAEDVKKKFTLILQKFNLYLIDSVCRYLLNFGLPKSEDQIQETINEIYGMIITSVLVESFFNSLRGKNITSGGKEFNEIYKRSNTEGAIVGGGSKNMFESLQSQDNIFGGNYDPKGTIISYILDKIEEEKEAGLINLTGGSISSRDFE